MLVFRAILRGTAEWALCNRVPGEDWPSVKPEFPFGAWPCGCVAPSWTGRVDLDGRTLVSRWRTADSEYDIGARCLSPRLHPTGSDPKNLIGADRLDRGCQFRGFLRFSWGLSRKIRVPFTPRRLTTRGLTKKQLKWSMICSSNGERQADTGEVTADGREFKLPNWNYRQGPQVQPEGCAHGPAPQVRTQEESSWCRKSMSSRGVA